MPTFGRWTYIVDRDATIRAYARASAGGADTCECAYCKNFRIVRAQVFPAAFLELLDELGIDFRKDAEVVHYGPMEDGRHRYEGWYHFAGRLEETGDFPVVEYGSGFSAYLQRASSPGLPIWDGVDDVVQLEFVGEGVPWLSSEPEPS